MSAWWGDYEDRLVPWDRLCNYNYKRVVTISRPKLRPDFPAWLVIVCSCVFMMYIPSWRPWAWVILLILISGVSGLFVVPALSRLGYRRRYKKLQADQEAVEVTSREFDELLTDESHGTLYVFQFRTGHDPINYGPCIIRNDGTGPFRAFMRFDDQTDRVLFQIKRSPA